MDYQLIHVPKCAGTSVRKALDIKKAGHLPYRRVNNPEDVFTFGFVRNPFDRIASLYRFQYRRNIYRLKSDDISFQHWFFLTLVEKIKPHFYNPEYWKPAYWWFSNVEGHLKVDWIGKVENIQDDWEELCEILNKSVILKKHNTTESKNEEYTTEMKEFMLEYYNKDFQYWYPEYVK